MARVSAVLPLFFSWAWGAVAAPPRACVASSPVAGFRLSVVGGKGLAPRPLRLTNQLRQGQILRFEPTDKNVTKKAEVAVILLPADDAAPVRVLDPKPASSPAEWVLPGGAATVAVVYGPLGLDRKKAGAMLDKKRELVQQLADYADQTAQVEALLGGTGNVNAALAGFAARYGVNTPKLDSKAPTDQQTAATLAALMPAIASYDPLATERAALVQQSVTLGSAVAALFFGSPVGLAAGGVAMFNNLRMVAFPDTEFRSAFVQAMPGDAVALCSKPHPARSRTRPAFLWAHRVPGEAAPGLSWAGAPRVPAPWKPAIKLEGDAAKIRLLDRAWDWRLENATGATFPAKAAVTPAGDGLMLDLTANPPPGDYRLTASWDWERFPIGGRLQIARFGDLAAARLTPQSADRLLEHGGKIALEVEGADFQFVESARLGEQAASIRERSPRLLLEVDLARLRRGRNLLVLTQLNGSAATVPVTVHPPLPRLDALPLRANSGEREQALPLTGEGLEQIERIELDGGEATLAPGRLIVRLPENAKKGDRLALRLHLSGRHEPLSLAGAISVLGPRPRIAAVTRSFPPAGAVTLRSGEIPASTTVSFGVRVENAGGSPSAELSCGRKSVVARLGDSAGWVRLSQAGDDTLFLSLDAGAFPQAGCPLELAIVTEEGTGNREPLGRLVRLPRIERLQLTEEALGDGLYAATIEGEGLETIAKTGWDAARGVVVGAIPAPVDGAPARQSLRIALPWPSPSPRAPLWIWLRGEREARPTTVRY